MSKICAHRGMLNLKHENTLSSFEEALKFDIDAIELDVHLTKDNELVVFHDYDLKRMCNEKTYIKDLTYDEIKSYKVQYIEQIPRLSDVIELVKDKNVELDIELKASSAIYPNIEQKVIDEIKRYDFYDKVIISSFDHRALKKIKEINKDIKVGAIYQGYIYDMVKYASNNGFDAIIPHYLCIDEDMIKQAKENNISTICYTISDLNAYNHTKAFDIDMIITDIADKISKEE